MSDVVRDDTRMCWAGITARIFSYLSCKLITRGLFFVKIFICLWSFLSLAVSSAVGGFRNRCIRKLWVGFCAAVLISHPCFAYYFLLLFRYLFITLSHRFYICITCTFGFFCTPGFLLPLSSSLAFITSASISIIIPFLFAGHSSNAVLWKYDFISFS